MYLKIICQGKGHRDIDVGVYGLDLLLEGVNYLDGPGKKSVFPDVAGT